MNIKGVIFDLDGVLVDTAKYHFLSWKVLAKQLKINFTENDNELLKGVSREESLEILLSLSPSTKIYTAVEKEEMLKEKNKIYLQYITSMTEKEILPGALELLKLLKKKNLKISLGSASKNAVTILKKTGLMNFFDVIVDGTNVAKAKPNPEVFILAAKKMGLKPENCLVIEDSQAGISAARKANMSVIAVDSNDKLKNADDNISNLKEFDMNRYL